MPDEFDSLFDDVDIKKKDDLQLFDDLDLDESTNDDDSLKFELTEEDKPTEEEKTETATPQKKRSSNDFELNQDQMFITAQSAMIIEGMKYLTLKKYSASTLQFYVEAIKGIDLFIKIIQRNNYHKLNEIIRQDIDCKEVEKIAFNLYRNIFDEEPAGEIQKLKAFELFKESLVKGYKKSLVSNGIVKIKKFFLMSGGVDTDTISSLTRKNDPEFKKEVYRFNKTIDIALEILKSDTPEVAKGMKGRDVSNFIVRAGQFLEYYYTITGNKQAADYFNRIHTMYNKYFVIK